MNTKKLIGLAGLAIALLSLGRAASAIDDSWGKLGTTGDKTYARSNPGGCDESSIREWFGENGWPSCHNCGVCNCAYEGQWYFWDTCQSACTPKSGFVVPFT